LHLPGVGFAHQQRLTRIGDVRLIPTPGHSAGHISVLVEEAECIVMLAGDSSDSQDLLSEDAVDGVGPDASSQ
jgi:glyoxylase-like metal-dependent hydrolase (beta-lactamase superfamily II)